MTFHEWRTKHTEDLVVLLSSLPVDSIDEIISYFDYDNMSKAHPEFCPLYSTSTKCHDMKRLNCFFCACPHFKCSDEPLFVSENGTKTMSICTISSKQAQSFTIDNISQCDCSTCFIPHTHSHIRRLLSTIKTRDELISFIKDS